MYLDSLMLSKWPVQVVNVTGIRTLFLIKSSIFFIVVRYKKPLVHKKWNFRIFQMLNFQYSFQSP